ncbi:MAG: hypothetical protein GY757_32840 [bacterium]|nr:hypothetical protein [bacterium]
MYYEKIKRYFDQLGKENVHVIIFDDFVSETQRVYREVLTFLEVDPEFEGEFDLKKATRIIRARVIEQLRHTHPEVERKLSKKTGLRAHQGPRRSPVTPQLKAHLKKLFREDIEKTSRLIDRDLTPWVS